MKTLVTGGAGFIGSNVVQLLLEEGHLVTVLDNLMSGYEANLDGMNVEFVRGDVRDAALVEKLVKAGGFACVFHLAASVGNKRSIDNPVTDSEINVLGTLNVLEAARRAGVRKLVYSSSAGIFGELKTLPIREDHPLEPDTPYGASKLCAEKLCLAYSKLHRMECCCLRYFNVYGPRQRFDAYGNVIPIFVHQILRGETITIFGDGEQTRDFINVRDVARANYAAATAHGVWGAFNLGSGTRITINHLVDLLRGCVSGRTALQGRVENGKNSGALAPAVSQGDPQVTGQRFSAAVTAPASDHGLHQGTALVVPSNPEVRVVHGPPRPGDVRDSLADIAKAQKELGWSPQVTMDAGLPEYVAWVHANMELAAAGGRR